MGIWGCRAVDRSHQSHLGLVHPERCRRGLFPMDSKLCQDSFISFLSFQERKIKNLNQKKRIIAASAVFPLRLFFIILGQMAKNKNYMEDSQTALHRILKSYPKSAKFKDDSVLCHENLTDLRYYKFKIKANYIIIIIRRLFVCRSEARMQINTQDSR